VTFDDYGTPRIVGYYNTMAGTDSLENCYMMIVDTSSVSVKDIKFDGYNFYYHQGYGGYYNPDSLSVGLPHHVTLQISGNGSYATIQDCEFQHMGRSIDNDSDDDALKHEAIIGSHPMGTGNTIYGIEILDNMFMNNPFDTSHGHEVYLTKNQNAEISGNTIYSNGVGTPIRFSYSCDTIDVENNEVYGVARRGFIHDWDGVGDHGSSNVIVKNNEFYGTTSTPYSASVANDYEGPATSYSDDDVITAFISEWSGNTVPLLGNKQWNIKGIATDGSTLFMTCNDLHSSDDKANYLLEFGEHNGPIFKGCGSFDDYYECDGNMVVFNDYVYVSTKYGSNMKVYRYNTTNSTLSTIVSGAVSSLEITAMCPYDSNSFITAVKEDDTYSRIYKCNTSTFLNDCIYEIASSTTITEMAVLDTGGTDTIIFSTDDGSSYKIYSASIPGSGDISPTEKDDISYDITGLTFYGTTLVTSIQYGTSTRIYTGSTSEPLPQSGGSFNVDGHVDYFSNTNIISLEADSEFIFTVKNKSTDSDEQRIIYFTDTASDLVDDIIFHSKWYSCYLSL